MSIDAISGWLDANSLLAFSVMTPALSALVGWVSSWLSVKRALRSEKERREHEAVAQISEFRQRWINDLRDRIADFGGLTSVHGSSDAMTREAIALVFKIELLMNPKDEDFSALRAALKYRLDAQGRGGTENLNPEYDNLLEISQRILKREWNRLKDELRTPKKFVETP